MAWVGGARVERVAGSRWAAALVWLEWWLVGGGGGTIHFSIAVSIDVHLGTHCFVHSSHTTHLPDCDDTVTWGGESLEGGRANGRAVKRLI
jgi:hypothetical protein